ncbi:hypothetical protein FEM48_Zijuj05G0182800 [Ziziphus jujuba var. spinosa]|uniref:Uncharacterized protein n=1 Tax=Ziziphus jujuba var. spinosa TaxID=714518 RepID=A0A978VGD7_ZIZJJ|nr:hypothetical protein FEM48_Zijuj05G0182800 [Ziziphus jujuba var. spinosa]
MAAYEKDEMPMLSHNHPRSSDDNVNSPFERFGRTQSVSFAISMNPMESYASEPNLVGAYWPHEKSKISIHTYEWSTKIHNALYGDAKDFDMQDFNLSLETFINRVYASNSFVMRLEMSLRRHDVEQWMSHRRLPEELRRRVPQAEQYIWAATRGVNEEILLENLPEDPQRDIRRHLFMFIKKVRIFSLMDEHILDAICERLRQKTYVEKRWVSKDETQPTSRSAEMSGNFMSARATERNFPKKTRSLSLKEAILSKHLGAAQVSPPPVAKSLGGSLDLKNSMFVSSPCNGPSMTKECLHLREEQMEICEIEAVGVGNSCCTLDLLRSTLSIIPVLQV